MKHMHFRASCSYTALAELLAAKGVDTEDFRIALEMKLPWLFAKEEDVYLAGPMLQGAKWFDLWLKPRGFRMRERCLEQAELCRFLREHPSVMLGLIRAADVTMNVSRHGRNVHILKTWNVRCLKLSHRA